MDKENKARFMQVYQNLLLNERKNTIVIIEQKGKTPERAPISWDIAYIEIDQETEVGEIILNKLIRLELI
mgnify:CR=1 FL=1